MQKISRRSFLRATGATAVVGAVFGLTVAKDTRRASATNARCLPGSNCAEVNTFQCVGQNAQFTDCRGLYGDFGETKTVFSPNGSFHCQCAPAGVTKVGGNRVFICVCDTSLCFCFEDTCS
jgi:hypothetical protein